MTTLADADVGSFIDDLLRELRDRRSSLLDGDFLAAVEAASVTRDQIREWARTFYAATRNGRLLLGNFYANSPDDPVLRRELAANLYEEETGRLSGVNRCHMEVFQDLLAAFDITPAEAEGIDSPMDYRPQGSPIAPEDFYVELSAYGLSVELPNAEFCARMQRALAQHFGFAQKQLTWFAIHAALDADHGEEFRKYVGRAARSPGGLARLRAKTLALAEVTKQIWDGFGRWRGPAASA